MNDRLLKRLILEAIQEVLSESEYEHGRGTSWDKKTGKTSKLTHAGKALKYLYSHKEGVDVDSFKDKFGDDIVSKLSKGEYIIKNDEIRLTRKGISNVKGMLDISDDEDED